MNDFVRSWRVLLTTVVVGMAAGLCGAWLGTAMLTGPPEDSFPKDLRALIDETGLQPPQLQRVDELTAEYLARRADSAVRLRTALNELAVTLVGDDGARSETTAAAERVSAITQERRMGSIAYISAVRAVLDSRQRRDFDTRFLSMIRRQPEDESSR